MRVSFVRTAGSPVAAKIGAFQLDKFYISDDVQVRNVMPCEGLKTGLVLYKLVSCTMAVPNLSNLPEVL